MEFASGRRYAQDPINFPPGCYYNERNIPLAGANGTRPDLRGCPAGGPVGGPRSRGSLGREDADSGQARRRIAVACARCRKRKIRCSGDPGDGNGCTNCKSAGVEPAVCQFHRVGSDSITNIVPSHVRVPLYNAANDPLYYRARFHWAVPYPEDTSPVETYSLDQPGAYLPSQSTMVSAHTYGSNCRWSQTGGKPYQGGSAHYMDNEPISVYETHGLPCIQTNIRSAPSEAISPLNMTALQLSLPGGPRSRQMHPSDQAVPQRQLPIPLPSPAQKSRNEVDQLLDQRLRSVQSMGRSSHASSGAFPKPALPFNSDVEVQTTAATDKPASNLATRATTSAPMSSSTDGSMGYLPIAPSVSAEATASASATNQLNFSTSTLLDAMPAPALHPAYSNFRNYSLPTSSPTETKPNLARQQSHTNLYSFSPDIKCHSGGASNDSALVSGHRYTPLSQSQPQHQQSLDGLRQDSFGARAVPAHRASMSNLDRSF